ncbi:hypothetical protein BDV96DRAFT_668357 [Lophiotrema nucula]|uniref:Uncharacterized protein n=1 Tax=Lophiotrema nucula TaxID=690887 RepID=A0A6A5ZTI3_9PLEO|nr:hypothetical protein BDV96DRAFT_668357 [Lophiotrema nucula]
MSDYLSNELRLSINSASHESSILDDTNATSLMSLGEQSNKEVHPHEVEYTGNDMDVDLVEANVFGVGAPLQAPPSNITHADSNTVASYNDASLPSHGPAKSSHSLPTAQGGVLGGIAQPPTGYDLRIPFTTVWSTQTLQSKSNMAQMRQFLRQCQVPTNEYIALPATDLAKRVQHQQCLNLAAKTAQDQAATARAPHQATSTGMKRAAPADGTTQAPKKIKSSESNPSKHIMRSAEPENFKQISASLKQVKIIAREEIWEELQQHGYPWHDDYEAPNIDEDAPVLIKSNRPGDDQIPNDSDSDPDSDEEDVLKTQMLVPLLVDKNTGKTLLNPEAQFRVRDAIRTKYHIRQLREDERPEKQQHRIVLHGRRNWTKLKDAVAKSVKGGHDLDKKGIAEEILRGVLGNDIDGVVINKESEAIMEQDETGYEGEDEA